MVKLCPCTGRNLCQILTYGDPTVLPWLVVRHATDQSVTTSNTSNPQPVTYCFCWYTAVWQNMTSPALIRLHCLTLSHITGSSAVTANIQPPTNEQLLKPMASTAPQLNSKLLSYRISFKTDWTIYFNNNFLIPSLIASSFSKFFAANTTMVSSNWTFWCKSFLRAPFSPHFLPWLFLFFRALFCPSPGGLFSLPFHVDGCFRLIRPLNCK